MNSTLEKILYGEIEFNILSCLVRLGLFQFILEKEKVNINEISLYNKELNLNKLERILNFAVSIQILQKDVNNKYFIDNNLKCYFDINNNQFIGNYIKHIENNTRYCLKNIDKILKDDFDSNKFLNVFENLYNDEKSKKNFLDTMWNIGYKDTLEILKNLKEFELGNLVDLGGGSGLFSIKSIQYNKAIKATIFDKLQIKDYINDKIYKYNLHNKVEFISGNFFEDKLLNADTYSLGYILSDYDDDKCKYLLNKVYNSLDKNGKILIMEKLFEEDKTQPYNTCLMDICMMIETGGKHRSFKEYNKLLLLCGFSNIKLIKTTGEKHAILAEKIN